MTGIIAETLHDGIPNTQIVRDTRGINQSRMVAGGSDNE